MRALSMTLLAGRLLLASLTGVSAQDASGVCPQTAPAAIEQAHASCADLQPDYACAGSGITMTVSRNGRMGMTQPGDRMSLKDQFSVIVAPMPGDSSSLSLASVAVRTGTRDTDLLTIVIMHDAGITTNAISDEIPEDLNMQATELLQVRAAPADDAPVLLELGINEKAVANGRHGDWLRVIVPTTGEIGWAPSAQMLPAELGYIEQLPQVSADDAVVNPFADISLIAFNTTAACNGALRSGMLLQSPSTDPENAVHVALNDVDMELAGTMLVVTEDNDDLPWTFFIVLEGSATLTGERGTQVVPAGAQSVVRLSIAPVLPPSAAPYDPALVTALPLSVLPREFVVVPPLTQAQIDAAAAS